MNLSITDVKGIGPGSVPALAEQGITSVKQLAKISVARLVQVPGFSDARARNIIRAAKALHKNTGQLTGGTSTAKPMTAKTAAKSSGKKAKKPKKEKKASKAKKSGKKAKLEKKKKKKAKKAAKGKKK